MEEGREEAEIREAVGLRTSEPPSVNTPAADTPITPVLAEAVVASTFEGDVPKQASLTARTWRATVEHGRLHPKVDAAVTSLPPASDIGSSSTSISVNAASIATPRMSISMSKQPLVAEGNPPVFTQSNLSVQSAGDETMGPAPVSLVENAEDMDEDMPDINLDSDSDGGM
jgi:hypothetical protein